jgi:hypothetical protein
VEFPRRISALPDPHPDEWFISWFDASRMFLRVPAAQLYRALGIPPYNRSVELSRWFSIFPLELERVVAASGLDESQVLAMFPQRYAGTVFAEWACSSAASANDEWVGHPRFAACSDCLRTNGGRWLVTWRLGWSFLCPEHRTYLTSTCPKCEKSLYFPENRTACHPWLRDRFWPWRSNPQAHPDPPPVGSDSWCYPFRTGAASYRKSRCLFPASKVIAPAVTDQWLLEFQRVLLEFASGASGQRQVQPWFATLKGSVEAVLSRSTSETLEWIDGRGRACDPDPVVAEAWRRWLSGRTGSSRPRMAWGRNVWARHGCSSGPPPPLLAAALRVLAAENEAWRDPRQAIMTDSGAGGPQ